jgi:hypothetical protein
MEEEEAVQIIKLPVILYSCTPPFEALTGLTVNIQVLLDKQPCRLLYGHRLAIFTQIQSHIRVPLHKLAGTFLTAQRLAVVTISHSPHHSYYHYHGNYCLCTPQSLAVTLLKAFHQYL